MLIIFQASLLGDDIIMPELYTAMVLVIVLTSIISPVYLRYLFKKKINSISDIQIASSKFV